MRAERQGFVDDKETMDTYNQLLGEACIGTGRYSAAIDAYGLLLASRPTNREALEGLGYAHFMLRDYTAAETFLRSNVRLNPEAASAHADLAMVYCAQGRTNAGLAEYQRALAIDPKNEQIQRDYQAARRNAVATTGAASH
jgi:tetratricopeptide (TPR) repeat protein